MTVLNFSGGDTSIQESTEQRDLTEEELEIREMVEMLAAWNEETWKEIFKENDIQFSPAKIVMFTQATESACGHADAAVGPFYCPADQKIYVDMSFFDQLQSDFGAEATEFTVAYVLAHEMGHHVQDLIGVLDKQDQLRNSGISEAEANKVSVAVELQADFFAGVWAKRNNERKDGSILESGDIESAMEAAAAVGDDNIQKRAQGQVNQDAFTHGSSKQRVEWFTRGYETGDMTKGDTFDELL